MTNYKTVTDFKTIIDSKINTITDTETRQKVSDLLDYAVRTENQASEEVRTEAAVAAAKNRPQRPRPDGNENAQFYREQIDFSCIEDATLLQAIQELLDYLEELEHRLFS